MLHGWRKPETPQMRRQMTLTESVPCQLTNARLQRYEYLGMPTMVHYICLKLRLHNFARHQHVLPRPGSASTDC